MPDSRKTIGSILLDSGVVSEQDLETALEHQRRHGGYLGEALLSLGLVQRPQVDWALASQFDLPYIVPEADSIDRGVAELVDESWALSNLAVPIVLAGDVLTVVVADPLHGDPIVEELSARTGYQVELALAAPDNIRELIRAIYSGGVGSGTGGGAQISLAELLAAAFEADARRVHISARGTVAWGWHAGGERTPLQPNWRDVVGRLVRPAPEEMLEGAGHGTAGWSAILRWAGGLLPMRVRALIGAGGEEYVLELGEGDAARPIAMPATMTNEIASLANTGARIAASGPDDRLVAAALPHLPWLVLGERARSLHVCAPGRDAPGVFSVVWDGSRDTLAGMDAFGLQAVTVDLPGAPDDWLLRALEAAPLGFIHADAGLRGRLDALRVTHRLLARPAEDGSITWSLTTLNSSSD